MAARLAKVENVSLSDKALGWVLNHPHLSLIILILTVTLIFALVFSIVYGMCTIESGVMRNFMNNSL